jgi:glycosyltransferase involved in cell wall biosynthesis
MQEESGGKAGGDLPLTAIIVVGHDVEALEGSMRGLTENAVLPGLHVCLLAPESMDEIEEAALQRLARLLDGRHSGTVMRFGSHPDFAALLCGVAAAYPRRDIALIAPGVDLPFAWDARLAKAAYAAPNIAAAIPLCDISPLYALLGEESRAESRLDPALVDRAAYCMGERGYYEIPRVHPICAYIRRDALDIALPHLAAIAEPRLLPDALVKQWRPRGLCCVICDYLYVGYSGNATAEAPAADDLYETAFLQNHPLGGLRRAVDDVIDRGLSPVAAPGLDHRPVRLHIMHYWGGGLERWVRDFGRADPATINMILATYRIGETGGQRIVLYADPAATVPVRTWDIARPIRSTASSSLEYRHILEQILAEFEIDAIIVSSLIGHALDALTLPRKTIVVCHDFYPICQAINPLFGDPCVRCTLDDLRRCAGSNPLNDLFGDQTSEEWHEMRSLFVSHLLRGRIEMVVPSPSVATTLRQLEPRLNGVPMHVIPHGIDLDAPRLPVVPRTASERLRIVVLGRMSTRKGANLLRAAANALRPLADITLVGCGETGVKLAEACGWNSIERYEQEALPDILRSLAPHVGLLPSIVPETFSYTLSELMSLGIPPVVTALGSFRDRVVDGESGFLFGPDAQALVGVVRRLHAQPEMLERVARHLASAARGRTTAEMVNDYRTLLPLISLPIARFRVGIGRQTGLTEPYRHLTDAYAQLAEAYARKQQAYERINAEASRWRWVVRAARAMTEFREKIRAVAGSPRVHDAGNGERDVRRSGSRDRAP